jgi:hypothetical protein
MAYVAGMEMRTRDLHATLDMCQCGHSAFVHEDGKDAACLYSVCPCSGFNRDAG